eukprot:TRINITY_DN1964_c0_g2_i2.p1 TRINITY_DN1964_c0_g2~~TRINITY_DN1964_c0_g2_i2.p1  ORF type:complete len:295 (-),score=53.50 TRINITY_DN1964_c0_g2_i2:615-1499(-)
MFARLAAMLAEAQRAWLGEPDYAMPSTVDSNPGLVVPAAPVAEPATDGSSTDEGVTPFGLAVRCDAWEECGQRPYMEDRHVLLPSFAADSSDGRARSFFAVYDGHAGSEVAQYCKQHLHQHLRQQPQFFSGSDSDAHSALEAAFAAVDQDLMGTVGQSGRLDGATAVVALLVGSVLHVANLGDCRAVLGRRSASEGRHISALRLSSDHKPDRPDEQRRVEKAGGTVMPSMGPLGCARVTAPGCIVALAVSRSLGDFPLKGACPGGLIAQPEIRTVPLTTRDRFSAVWNCCARRD